MCDIVDVPLQQMQKAPYAVVLGGHKDPKLAFMVMDKKIICEIPIDDIPIYLIAVFYIFNICYPTGCQNLYCFLEVILLRLQEPQISINVSVKNFLARLPKP